MPGGGAVVVVVAIGVEVLALLLDKGIEAFDFAIEPLVGLEEFDFHKEAVVGDGEILGGEGADGEAVPALGVGGGEGHELGDRALRGGHGWGSGGVKTNSEGAAVGVVGEVTEENIAGDVVMAGEVVRVVEEFGVLDEIA